MKLLLEISYDGTAYHGFQVQPNLPTVQGTLQKHIEKLLSQQVKLTGCSRTDAGVHARQFFCSVECESTTVPIDKIPLVLNNALPVDIAVRAAKTVPDSFHVRYDVVEKEYVYQINNSITPNPLEHRYMWHISRRSLDIEAMILAAAKIEGKRDWSSFMAQGSKIIDAVRDVKYCKVMQNGSRIDIAVCADGFLYNMVRIIAGTLVWVGKNKLRPKDVEWIIASQTRSDGMTAPPQGLFLQKVLYKSE